MRVASTARVLGPAREIGPTFAARLAPPPPMQSLRGPGDGHRTRPPCALRVNFEGGGFRLYARYSAIFTAYYYKKETVGD